MQWTNYDIYWDIPSILGSPQLSSSLPSSRPPLSKISLLTSTVLTFSRPNPSADPTHSTVVIQVSAIYGAYMQTFRTFSLPLSRLSTRPAASTDTPLQDSRLKHENEVVVILRTPMYQKLKKIFLVTSLLKYPWPRKLVVRGWFQGGPGSRLRPDSRFKVEAKLRFGTTSSLWVARDLRKDNYVALKILNEYASKIYRFTGVSTRINNILDSVLGPVHLHSFNENFVDCWLQPDP
ncbi:hypothetical protein DFJ58DRAFT_916473 [Suillus subalutaceus]|uniref:uncharacterized protein n=1 Tax=Suillus subalutaceus TaxID=48586 RepID=UPI001B86B24D|nr:uncharacterized protein DFJ58DRAFT_916473 [Suillus subalutaceus]KAG1841433.1 hypothetical protein DFJ58DRAFT_916473 [Suillus subalutaceus]